MPVAWAHRRFPASGVKDGCAPLLVSGLLPWHDAGVIPLMGQTLASLTGELGALGHKPYRARQILDWVYEKRVADFASMTDLPAALRGQLAERFPEQKLEQVRMSGSGDTTPCASWRSGATTPSCPPGTPSCW